MDLILALIIAAGILLTAWKGSTLMPKGAPQTAVEQKPENPWIYPGATPVAKNTFQSNDDPAAVTAWYQNLINQAEMTVTSFVVTNTNNNIVNRLVGATRDISTDIEISRMAGEKTTTIKINAGLNSSDQNVPDGPII